MTQPQIVRPARRHAIEFALDMFMRGERVDMQTLAASLGVGRTTLYRWVGDRERLIGEVLAILTRYVWVGATADAKGQGVERGLDAIGNFMRTASEFRPLRQFVEAEPGLALRVLLAEHGPVSEAIRACATQMWQTVLPESQQPTPELVEVCVQLGTALQWAPTVAGEEPPIERTIGLMRTVLQAAGVGSVRS